MTDPQGTILYLDGIMEDITDRKKAELELKESENKFRILAEQSRTMIFINTGSQIAYVNKKCEELLGYSKEEFYAPDFDFLKLIAAESQDLVIHNFSRWKQGEEIAPYECVLVAKQGNKIDVIMSISTIDYQKKRAFLGTVTDISGRKLAEKELIRSKNNFTLAAKLAHLGPWGYDPLKREFIFNDEFYAILGTDVHREGMTMSPQKYFREFIHPDDTSLMKPGSPRLQALPGLDNANRIEHRIIRRDGQVRYVAVLSRLIKDTEGKIIEWYGANQDITESKLAEEALRISEDKYRSLVHNIRLGIFRSTTDAGGRILEANTAIEEITGYSRNELLSMAVKDLYAKAEERLRLVEQIVSTPGKASFETSFIKKDRSRIDVSITAKAIKDDRGKVLYIDGILEDVTEKKKLEEGILDLYKKEKKHREELQEEAKARGMFTDILAHELRTPLTPIIASAEMLLDIKEKG